MQVIRWQATTSPQEQELRRRMQQEGLSPYTWSNAPGDTYAVHSHTYEKYTVLRTRLHTIRTPRSTGRGRKYKLRGSHPW